MKDQELAKVLQCLEEIPNEQSRADAMEIVLKAAAESITMERLKKISSFREEKKIQGKEHGYIKFKKNWYIQYSNMKNYLNNEGWGYYVKYYKWK